MNINEGSINKNQLLVELEKQEDLAAPEEVPIKTITWKPKDEFGAVIVNGERYKLTKTSMYQLCRTAKIPVSFFVRVSEKLKADIMGECLTRLNKHKALIVNSSGSLFVRGIVPEDSVWIPKRKVADVLVSEKNLSLRLIQGMDLFSPVYHMRGILTDSPVVEGDLYPGISIIGSEIGEDQVRVEVLLFKLICSNGMVTSFGGSSFYRRSYSGINFDSIVQEVKFACNKAVEKRDTFKEIVNSLERKKLSREQVERAINRVIENRSLSKSFGLKMKAAVENEEKPEHIKTKNDLMNLITFTAQSLPILPRIHHERYAGIMAGATFDRRVG